MCCLCEKLCARQKSDEFILSPTVAVHITRLATHARQLIARCVAHAYIFSDTCFHCRIFCDSSVSTRPGSEFWTMLRRWCEKQFQHYFMEWKINAEISNSKPTTHINNLTLCALAKCAPQCARIWRNFTLRARLDRNHIIIYAVELWSSARRVSLVAAAPVSASG
jgi:hypothetical protein